MSAAKVTVLTVTHNHENFIECCIDSVRAQTFEDWEMVIVDDNSTDRTCERIDRYRDPRIRVVHQGGNGIAGLAVTYNAGLAAARGSLVAILEGDDYWAPNKLARQVKDFDRETVVLSSGMTQVVSEDGTPVTMHPENMPCNEGLQNEPIGVAALSMLHPSHLSFTFPVSTVIRKTALEAVGGFLQPDYLPVVDLPTFLRLTLEGRFVFHLGEPLGFWRRHGLSTTKSRLPEILDGVYRHAAEFFEAYGSQLPVTNAEIAQLSDHWSAFMVHRFVTLGRWLYSEGERDLAKKAFSEARKFGGPYRRRVKSGIGSFAMAFNLPIEPRPTRRCE